MLYDIKEYKNEFFQTNIGEHTSLEKCVDEDKQLGLASIIIRILNKNKYDSLEDFINRNSNYQDFLKNNNSDFVVLHFGNFNKNKISEADFLKVLNNLKTLSTKKQNFEKNNIKTTNIENKEYNSYKGENKTYFIDNSNSKKSIEDQMKDLQNTQQEFQTSDMKQNTENMFKELEENKKESLNLRYLNEIDYLNLNNEEKILYKIAMNYQQNIPGLVRIDLNKSVMVDEYENIKKIDKENGEYVIKSDENGIQKEEKTEEYTKSYQKQLTLTPNTMYSSNSN